jgi:hypothetical protein
MDDSLLSLYKKGYSIDYLAKKYYSYVNKNRKTIRIGDTIVIRTKIKSFSECRLYVVKLIADNIHFIYNGLP